MKFFLIILSLFLISGCSSVQKTIFEYENMYKENANSVQSKTKNETSQKKNTTEEVEEENSVEKEDIEILFCKMNRTGQLIYSVRNNKNIPEDIVFYVHFYNETGKEMKTISETLPCVGVDETIFSFISSSEIPENFSDYKAKIDFSESSVKNLKNEISYTTENKEKVLLSGDNLSSESLSSLSFVIEYKYEGEVLCCNTLYFTEIAPYGHFSSYFESPKDANGNELNYDDYSIFLKEAWN